MAELGNGSAQQGKIDISPIGVDCSFFTRNPVDPPPPEEITAAIVQVLQKWLLSSPVRVRATLPVMEDGKMIALFVWWDRVNIFAAK